jgi:hypothetical protein
VVALRPLDGPAMCSVRDALFAAAIGWHRDRGSRSVLYLAADGQTPPPPGLPCYELDMVRALIPGRAAPRLIEHLNNLWAHR